MNYFSELQIKSYGKSQVGIKDRQYFSAYKTSDAKKSVFLCHSHADIELIEGFLSFLSTIYKDKVYVDWKDTSMPPKPNRETAEMIKRKIESLDIFIVLATNNALKSHWVPWEIGIADSKKSLDKIIIFPVADPSGKFDGSEYLQLYSRFEPISDKEIQLD